VENGTSALSILRENIEALELGGVIVGSTVQDFLKRSSDTFDLVFMDPPWWMSSDDMSADLTVLDRLVVPKAEIVVSRHHTDNTPTIPKKWRVATDKRYGDTRILRYEKETRDE